MNLSIVIPCYRSEASLPDLGARIVTAMRAGVAEGLWSEFEVILVVDGSPDRTSHVAHGLATEHAEIRVIDLRRNYGQHNALVAGIRDANNSIIVTMDDDLQHPPEEIRSLIAPLRENPLVDLVYAVPQEEEHGRSRSAASRIVKLALVAAGVQNADLVGAFRAFRLHLRDGFAKVEDPNVNLDVVLAWSTASIVGQRVIMNRRMHGRSNYSMRRLVQHALNMITGYGVLPLKLATWLGFACAAVGIVLMIVVLIRYATGETTVAGFTTLAAIISLFSGAQLYAMGIIGEYVGRQHFRGMNRPMYVIKDD